MQMNVTIHCPSRFPCSWGCALEILLFNELLTVIKTLSCLIKPSNCNSSAALRFLNTSGKNWDLFSEVTDNKCLGNKISRSHSWQPVCLSFLLSFQWCRCSRLCIYITSTHWKGQHNKVKRWQCWNQRELHKLTALPRAVWRAVDPNSKAQQYTGCAQRTGLAEGNRKHRTTSFSF